ncbi:fumarylacetoacetate hydrolase family protein [Ruegeria sp. Ofav3-42]|uniref:fumarylacetoacetate hydrolase family protein n=1 Tax=Ruegeria sp. Ofav3-42 TaxID=2917759 RepID=UPI001EF57F1C|nr:fumarylacetoacetate hydrolase family protein [Ruegeria sp. Ofav3-42]MCG7519855.1 fumarylacetoacetate hydrolase family protein [Ruegeria sp. Ofav3-42]
MIYPKLDCDGVWLGRVERAGIGPCVVTLRDGQVVDITSKIAPTVRDVLEREDAAEFIHKVDGTEIGGVDSEHDWLAPCDLQAIKACGVTFAGSMVERVIEEKAAGDPGRAQAIRARIGDKIGSSLSNITPGSDAAAHVKQALIAEDLWSQYLEVGIGPDAEVFTKAQVLSSVGFGADVGLHPISTWNNPEPEVVLAVTSTGVIKGATLGNDVNLRDVEGRSALLLGKAKDNNASCAIGPMIRLFDDTYTLEDVRTAELSLTVTGMDGFVLSGHSSMSQISRDPADLVTQTIGRHHQYPDGLMLFLGTLFAPTQDRDTAGGGFTHKLGDIVTIANDKLGTLTNNVRLSTECPEWRFGVSHLMRNLAQRGLL